MTIPKALLVLIVLMIILFPAAYVVSQDYLAAILALGLGTLWLVLEINGQPNSSSLFFVCFLGFAMWGSLRGLPIPVLLVGLSLDLAAWDLSRFRARTADDDPDTDLEAAHLQKLAVTIGAGFSLALLSTLIRLSISLNFVIFCVIVLLTVIVLRKAALSLRN